MSLLPDTASLEERIQECFLAYRGRGVSLSGLDAELVVAWAATQVPVEVIARGIRIAAEAHAFDAARGEDRLRNLLGCRRHVEKEIDKYLQRAAGRHPVATELAPKPAESLPAATTELEPLHLARHKRLLATLRKLAKTQTETSATAKRLAETLPPPDDLVACQAQEDMVVGTLLLALPSQVRKSLLHEARGLMQNASAMSARALRESRRFHRAALLRRHLNLPPFW